MAKRTAKRGSVEAGTGNVFADLGLPDAEDLDTKLRLAVELNRLLNTRRLSQVRAASMLGISQPKVSALKHYKLEGFSVERLMVLLTVMGLDVEIRIKEHRSANVPGRIAGRGGLSKRSDTWFDRLDARVERDPAFAKALLDKVRTVKAAWPGRRHRTGQAQLGRSLRRSGGCGSPSSLGASFVAAQRLSSRTLSCPVRGLRIRVSILRKTASISD